MFIIYVYNYPEINFCSMNEILFIDSMEVKVCPVCDSQNINSLHSPLSKWGQALAFFVDRCNNCGYAGPMTKMEKKHADKLKVLKLRTSFEK